MLVKASLMPGAASAEGPASSGWSLRRTSRAVRRPARALPGTSGTVPGCEPGSARGGARNGRFFALGDEFGDVLADRGERFQRLVGVDRQFFEHRVLARQDLEHLVEFLQRRVGAADDRAEVAAAARRPAPSSLMMIVKRSRSGSRVMSLSRSGSTGLEGVRDRQQYWPAPSWPEGIRFSGGGSGEPSTSRLGGDAVDVLLADQALRADRAAGVAAEVLEAGVRRC